MSTYCAKNERKKSELQIEKLEKCPSKNPGLLVKLTEMGNILEVQYMSKRNCKQTIQMLPGGREFIELATGEIKPCQIHETRAEQKNRFIGRLRTLEDLLMQM